MKKKLISVTVLLITIFAFGCTQVLKWTEPDKIAEGVVAALESRHDLKDPVVSVKVVGVVNQFKIVFHDGIQGKYSIRRVFYLVARSGEFNPNLIEELEVIFLQILPGSINLDKPWKPEYFEYMKAVCAETIVKLEKKVE